MRTRREWDSSMVADVLDIVRVREVQARSTQPVWLNVWVPADAQPGSIKVR